MASPTQEEFVRSLTLAVRPSTLRAPVLTYSSAETALPLRNPAQQPAPYQPVTRAMALFMANILLVGWVSAVNLMRETTIDERERAALAALELGNPRQDRTAIASISPEMTRALIEQMPPSENADLAANSSLPDIPHPRDTVGYAQIDRALSPGSSLSMQERRKLLDAVRDTTLLAYQMQMGTDVTVTGALPRQGSNAESGEGRAQMLGQGHRPSVRRVDIDMDKPSLRGSL